MVDQAQAPLPSPGIQAYKTKDFAQAIMLLNGEVQADPTDTKLKLYLGLSYFGANNHIEAKNVLDPLRTECTDGALKDKLETVLAQIEKALSAPPAEIPNGETSIAAPSESIAAPSESIADPSGKNHVEQQANFAEALAFLNEGDSGAGFGTVAPAGVRAEVLPAFAERQAAKEAAALEETALAASAATSEAPIETAPATEITTPAPVEFKPLPPEEHLSDDDPIINSGLSMYNQGDFEGCARVLKRRITQIPNHWKARLYLGRCQHLLHDYLAAERTLSFLLTNSDSEEARAAADAEISKFRSAMRTAEPRLDPAQPQHQVEVTKERTPVESFPAVEAEHAKPKVQIEIRREYVAGVLAVVLLGVLVYMAVGMYVSNSNLYESIFLRPTQGQELPAQDMEIMGIKGELLEIPGAAGSKLSAIIYRKPDSRKVAIINHDFDGNMNSRLDYVRLFLKADMSVLLYDYSGFGKSTGEATLGHISGEGFLVADYLQGREEIAAEDMVFFGEYLGCAVAEQMGQYRTNAAVILHGPFPSYIELAREKYPFLKLYSDSTIPNPHGDAEPFLKTHTTPVLLVMAPNKGLVKRDYVEKLLPQTIDVKNKYEVPDYSGPMPDKVQDEYAVVIKQFVHDYAP